MGKITLDNYLDNHYIQRSNWLRAAVLGPTMESYLYQVLPLVLPQPVQPKNRLFWERLLAL